MSGCSRHGREVTWHPQPKVTAGKSPDSHTQKRAWTHVAAQLQAPFIQARTQAQGMRPSTVVGLSIPANITKIIIPLRNSEALLPGHSRLCQVNKSNHHHNCASLRLSSANCISWQGTEGWTGHFDVLHYKDRHACNSMLWGESCRPVIGTSASVHCVLWVNPIPGEKSLGKARGWQQLTLTRLIISST